MGLAIKVPLSQGTWNSGIFWILEATEGQKYHQKDIYCSSTNPSTLAPPAGCAAQKKLKTFLVGHLYISTCLFVFLNDEVYLNITFHTEDIYC